MSEIWKHYEQLMAAKIVKSATKDKETDYNIKVPSAGVDDKVETSGYDLVENISHPGQIQVADGLDGIVENGVQQQKVMMDVALRNPRGVIAELMGVLVKAAEYLESDLTDEGIKTADYIDTLLLKLARDVQSSDQVVQLAEEVLSRFSALDFSTFGLGTHKEAKETIRNASLMIKQFEVDAKNAGSNIDSVIQTFAAHIKQVHQAVVKALADTTDWGSDAEEARDAWDNLKLATDAWSANPVKNDNGIGVVNVDERQNLQHEKPKASIPQHNQSGHHYSVEGPEVEYLQKLLGVSVDGKFGDKTLSALVNMARTNEAVRSFLKNSETTSLPSNYAVWTKDDVEKATLALKQNKPAVSSGDGYIRDPYSPDQQKWQVDQETQAKQQLSSKYPEMEVSNNHIYPQGLNGVAFPLSDKWVNYLKSA